MCGSIKKLALAILTAVFGIFMIAGPVFADPAPTTDEPGTSVQTPDQDDRDDQNDQETAEDTEEEADKNTCYDEVGGLGWIICPGAGLLAKVIDGAYDILEKLIQVDPLPTDQQSPIYVVWKYLRGITNVVFIIFLLIVIYSQLTGLGINNYGIKRVLPRIIVAAILVNLSYIICMLAVDVSNILGHSLQGVFHGIEEQAIANSQISDTAANTSITGIVATVLGIGAAGTFVTLAVGGGVVGVIWMLLPVLLSGALAIVSAVITMAARQALVMLLAMISPLALVCYLLPNTEKWYKKWLNMFVSMLVFYPMFSVLFGATQLAGLAIITSAGNWLTVILGIAVQILPLFLAIPLLKMSGTVLGKVSGLVDKAGSPARKALGARATEGRELARQRQLNSSNRIPHNRLARFLDDRKSRRAQETAELANRRASRNKDSYTRSYFRHGNINGALTRRGARHYEAERQNMEFQTNQALAAARMDEGFNENDPNLSRRAANSVRQTNDLYKATIANSAIASAYATTVKYDNMKNRAKIIEDGINNQNSAIHRQVLSTFNTNGDANKEQAAISAVLSDAIVARRKADSEAKSNYTEFFSNIEPGADVGSHLEQAIRGKDYNAMVTAIQTMAVRGDYDNLGRILRENSQSIESDKSMQRELRDSLIKMKGDDATLWAWAKANMIRTSLNNQGKQIESYIDFESFMRGDRLAGDLDDKYVSKINVDNIISGITDSTIAKSQDRTVFSDILDMQRNGTIQTDANGKLSTKFSIKQLRSAAVSGAMDGDQLAALNSLLTGGYSQNMSTENQAWFNQNKDAIKANIIEFVGQFSTNQLATAKTASIVQFNDTLMAIDPQDVRTLNGHRIAGSLADALASQTAELCRPNAVAQRNGMPGPLKELLGIREIDPRGRGPIPGGTQDAR